MTFSRRASPDRAPNRLATALAQGKSLGRPILDLTESNPTRAGVAYDRDALLRAIAPPAALSYEPEPFGMTHAREAVAKELGAQGLAVPASRIVLTASTSEAYAFVFKLLCDPGEEVLVPEPSYPLFELLARFEGVRLVPYPLVYDGAWHIDTRALERARSPRTRAVLLVSPNNPTGSYVKMDELAALESLGLPLVSDEVFASYPFGPDPRRAGSALEARGTLVFALGGLSKLAGLPQMKLAWIAAGGPEALLEAALSRLELIADSFLSVGTPVQHALPALLAAGQGTRRAILARTRHNLETLRALVHESAATLLSVEGGWYATLRLPRTLPEEEWALRFLEEDAVYVHPGHFFDFAEEAFVVISLLVPEELFGEGVRRILSRVGQQA